MLTYLWAIILIITAVCWTVVYLILRGCTSKDRAHDEPSSQDQ